MIEQSTSQLKELLEGPPAVQTVRPSVHLSVASRRFCLKSINSDTKKDRRTRSLPLDFSIPLYLYLSIYLPLPFPFPSLRSNSFLPSSSVLSGCRLRSRISFFRHQRQHWPSERMAERRKTTRRRTGAAPSLPHPSAAPLRSADSISSGDGDGDDDGDGQVAQPGRHLQFRFRSDAGRSASFLSAGSFFPTRPRFVSFRPHRKPHGPEQCPNERLLSSLENGCSL